MEARAARALWSIFWIETVQFIKDGTVLKRMIDIGSGELASVGTILDDCTGSGRSELLLPYKRFTRHKIVGELLFPLPAFLFDILLD